MKTFSQRLSELRNGLSYKAFSAKTGVPAATLERLEKTSADIKSDQTIKICTSCGVSADWLLTGHEDAPPAPIAAAPPVPRPPSAEDSALLRRLYDLADAAQAPHQAAYAAKDTAAMAVPGLLQNFADLVRVIDADTATLGLLGSLLYMVRIGITSDRKHLDFAKALLDRLAGDQ